MTGKNSTELAEGIVRPGSGRAVGEPLFADHSLVRLPSGFSLDDGRTLPAGAVGAVVGTWAGGAAYEVEFSEPFHVVATIPAAKLAEARDRSR